jgi:hypothetical protein
MKAFWKNEELEDTKTQSHILLDTTNIFDKIPELFKYDDTNKIIKNNQVQVTETLWEDSGLKDWAYQQCFLTGSHHYLWNFIKQPTYDTNTLISRQNVATFKNLNLKTIDYMKNIKTYEKDVIWLLQLPPLKEAWPLNLAFPSFPIFKYINYFPILLDIFHFYRIFVAPLMNIATPISTLIGPWIYLRKTMKMNITFSAYSNLLYVAMSHGLKTTGNIRTDSLKYISLFLYCFFYIYAIIQCIEHARILYTILRNLNEKFTSIQKFIENVQFLMNYFPKDFLKDFLPKDFVYPKLMKLPRSMSGLYTLCMNQTYKNNVHALLQWIYALDTCIVSHRLIKSKLCCLTEYNLDKPTQIWNMGHLLLGKHQIKNPFSIKKNLIITGPNAAGKTTYVRAVCTNLILAHTFGIVCGISANISPVHAMGSFMRINDNLGTLSLFEAETKRCAELLEQADTIVKDGKSAIYFLDEPMHSTPPIEGCATSMAVIEHMGSLPNIKVLVTTHYHECIYLENMHPELFQNISMDAYMTENGVYTFPYRIQNGASIKCIALELLNEKKMPKNVIKRAIDLKNKICQQQVNA